MVNFEENKMCSSNLIPVQPITVLNIYGSGSGRKNSLLKLIYHQLDFYKTFLYAKDLSEPK